MEEPIVANVDLRIVAETHQQLTFELTLLQQRHRVHVIGWQESYWTKYRKPRGKKVIQAIKGVTQRLAEFGTDSQIVTQWEIIQARLRRLERAVSKVLKRKRLPDAARAELVKAMEEPK